MLESDDAASKYEPLSDSFILELTVWENLPLACFLSNIYLISLKDSPKLRSPIWAVRSKGGVHGSVFFHLQRYVFRVVNVSMLVRVKEEDVVFVANSVSFGPIFIARQNVKDNSAWCRVH